MKLQYKENLQYLENEFEEAHWNKNSGLEVEELTKGFNQLLEDNKDLPVNLLRAKAFAFLLDNGQIEINPHNIFADKLNTGVVYDGSNNDGDFLVKQRYEAGPDIMENNMFYPLNRSVQQKKVPEMFELNQKMIETGYGRACSDFRHACPDWNNVFKYGIRGLYELAIEEKKNNPEKSEFYDGVIESYEAILRYMNRLYEESLNYDIPWYTDCIYALMHNPPQHLYEGMELSFLFTNMAEIGYEKVRTLGLLDQMYYPLYQKDIEEGIITKEDAKEMLRFFFTKWHAARRGALQPLGIGGVKEDGSDAVNELTYMFLEVYDEIGVINPKIHIRVRHDTPKEFIRYCASLIRKGSQNIVLMNDDVIYEGYKRIGIPLKDAQQYLPLGCYEPFIMGKEEAMICASWLNLAKSVELTISGGYDLLTNELIGLKQATNYKTFEGFQAAFYKQLDYSVKQTMDIIEAFNSITMDINPSPVLSGTMTSCLEKGMDIYEGGMEYNNSTIKCYGIGTTVDSILAVKKLVYEEELLTMDELQEALKKNWVGYESIQTMILKDGNKYGNHLVEPDTLAKEIYEHLGECIIGKPTNRGGVYRMGADSVDFCATEGKKMAASADGRNARTPISKNLCGVSGMQKHGLLASMQSALSIDQSLILGSAPLDFILHPSQVAGDSGLEAMTQIIMTYFKNGGTTLHGNVMNVEQLMDAVKNPNEYKELQIRVCGWNDYFVNLSKEQQQEFIKQAERI